MGAASCVNTHVVNDVKCTIAAKITDVNKDSSLKAKARTKAWTFKAKVRTKDCFHLSV